jgi:hypothetical protein
MQPDSHGLRPTRHLAGLFVSLAISSAVASLGGAVAANEPAKGAPLLELSGPTAEAVSALEYAKPVLVAYAQQGWIAVVFDPDPKRIPDLLRELLVEEVAGCVRDGAITCCNEATNEFVFNTERGWIRLGEFCEDPDEDEYVDVVRLDRKLTEALFDCCGIVDEYVDLANPDGSARMLWNWPPISELKRGELVPASLLIRVSEPSRATPPIVLAHDHPPPSPACVDDMRDVCDNNKRKKRCDPDSEHWFKKRERDGVEQWCARSGCRCR